MLKSAARIAPSNLEDKLKNFKLNTTSKLSDLSAEIRCYGCAVASNDCTVPCKYPSKCFMKGSNASSTSNIISNRN